MRVPLSYRLPGEQPDNASPVQQVREVLTRSMELRRKDYNALLDMIVLRRQDVATKEEELDDSMRLGREANRGVMS